MNNEPVAWMSTTGNNFVSKKAPSYVKAGTNDWIPLYTHPHSEESVKAKTLKDREADRKRFSDEGFNRWLDESISDSGHTVYDLVENVCEAWHGWENSQYYRPAKTLTDEEIENIAYKVFEMGDGKEALFEFAKAILRKASEK